MERLSFYEIESHNIYSLFLSLFFSSEGLEVDLYQEYPLKLLAQFEERTGHKAGPMIVLNLEYGANFSGPGNDVFHLERAIGEPSEAHKSNFLHPVLYYYEELPTGMYIEVPPKITQTRTGTYLKY